MIRSSIRGLLACAAMSLLFAGCGKPNPPDKEQPPEPQAHTELRDAIQQPIDKAKQVDVDVQKAADEQRAAIEAAGG